MGKLRLKAFTLEAVHKCQVLNDSKKKMDKQKAKTRGNEETLHCHRLGEEAAVTVMVPSDLGEPSTTSVCNFIREEMNY